MLQLLYFIEYNWKKLLGDVYCAIHSLQQHVAHVLQRRVKPCVERIQRRYHSFTQTSRLIALPLSRIPRSVSQLQMCNIDCCHTAISFARQEEHPDRALRHAQTHPRWVFCCDQCPVLPWSSQHLFLPSLSPEDRGATYRSPVMHNMNENMHSVSIMQYII